MGKPIYKSIAIIRLSALGDIVHALPAFHLLRTSFPDAKICWFAQPPGSKLLENIKGIDQIVPVHLKTNGTRNKWKEVRRVLKSHCRNFDMIIDFQGLFKSAIFGKLLKGETLGFDKQNLKEPLARLFYSRKAPAFDEADHVIYKNIHLARQLLAGESEDESPMELHYPVKSAPPTPQLKRFLADNGLREKGFFVVNVGGGWDSKLMSAQQHIQLINKIKSLAPVTVLWGNEKEEKTARQVVNETGAILTPFLDFSELITFIRMARLTVTGDTLALHVSDMVNTPSVGVFGPTSPFRNGSLLPSSIHIFDHVNCNFCYKKSCDTITCLNQIDIATIVEAVESINEKLS